MRESGRGMRPEQCPQRRPRIRSSRRRWRTAAAGTQPPSPQLTQALNPSRQLANRGSQPSAFLVFTFDDPREVVIWATTNSPASSRPSQAGSRSGGFAPATRARYGSHSATGAGALSTTLYTPGAPRPTAATVAAAASVISRNDQTPVPPPITG